MNKWQIIVLWVMVMLISLIMVSTPINRWYWMSVGQVIIPILLIGGLLIFTLRKPPIKIVKYITIFIGLLCLIVIMLAIIGNVKPTTEKPVFDYYSKEIEKPKVKVKWRQLQKDMTETQVRDILGEPDRVDASGVFYIYWYYGNEGYVMFDKDKNCVSGWKEY